MVGAAAADDAVERARRLPDLAIGLHVVLVNGRPILPAEQIPDLVGRDGEFLTDLVAAGVRFFFRPGVRAQLAAEIRAQFERFAQTGLALDHVDAQNHMHVHPTVFGLIQRIGREYEVRAVRIPREPFGGTRTIAPWLALMRARTARAGVVCNDYVYGVTDVGALTEQRVLQILGSLPDGVTEIFFHPSVDSRGAHELASLLSSRVRDAIAQNNIMISTYGELTHAAT